MISNPTSGRYSKRNKIKTTELFDLTGSGEMAVLLISKRDISHGIKNSEADELKAEAINSPWTSDNQNKVFAERSIKKKTQKDPKKELKSFLEALIG